MGCRKMKRFVKCGGETDVVVEEQNVVVLRADVWPDSLCPFNSSVWKSCYVFLIKAYTSSYPQRIHMLQTGLAFRDQMNIDCRVLCVVQCTKEMQVRLDGVWMVWGFILHDDDQSGGIQLTRCSPHPL